MASIAEADATLPPDLAVRQANDLLTAGDTEGALALLAPFAAGERMDLAAQFLLSMVAWKMGRLDWSLELMRQCHEAFPMDGTVAEALASLYAQAGDLRESLFMGKLGTALGGPGALSELVPAGFPNFDWAFYSIKEKPLLAEAKAKLAAGELEAAVEKARQHAALNPQDGDARGFYAGLLLRAGAASSAVEVLHAVARNADPPPAYASLYARALCAVGEFAEARRWHERATAAAPEDVEIAAARVADGLWLERDPADLAALARGWAERFCAAAPPRQWRKPAPKLTIGYLVANPADRADMASIAAVARAHDRARVTVIGYGHGAQSSNDNAPLGGAFDVWQDMRGLDPATLARFFARDGLHVAIDASGFAAPVALRALARLGSAVRVSWLGNPAGLLTPIYDAHIIAASSAAGDGSAWAIAGGYPLLPAPRSAATRNPRETVQFGADISMAQLDAETVRLWSAVLDAVPAARLLLRGNDMGPGGNIDRLIARFGRDRAARIDIVADETVEGFYGKLDVALLPRRGGSARAAAEALAHGVPAVAIGAGALGEPYAALLRDLGLGTRLAAADAAEYVSIAAGLAASADERNALAPSLLAVASDGAARFARALEEHAIRALDRAEAATP